MTFFIAVISYILAAFNAVGITILVGVELFNRIFNDKPQEFYTQIMSSSDKLIHKMTIWLIVAGIFHILSKIKSNHISINNK